MCTVQLALADKKSAWYLKQTRIYSDHFLQSFNVTSYELNCNLLITQNFNHKAHVTIPNLIELIKLVEIPHVFENSFQSGLTLVSS